MTAVWRALSPGGAYRPGVVLDRRRTGSRPAIALNGKVFCQVDAAYGPIRVGDLLVSSATPGHAMAATDFSRAPGAVLGKALRGWSAGARRFRSWWRSSSGGTIAATSACGRSPSSALSVGSISVNSDVYGYIFRDTDGSVFGTLGANDTLPGSGQPTQRSLKRHLQTISGKSAELVLISSATRRLLWFGQPG